MSQHYFSRDAEPIDIRAGRADAVRDWLSVLLPPLAIVGAMAGFWLLYQMATTPAPPPAILSYDDSFANLPPSTYPPEFLVAAIAISTSLAPTPSPSPIPYRTPTPPIPTIYCGLNSDPGQECQWPQPTIVATEMPVCLTPIPMDSCVWRGNLIGTPIAIASGGKGI